jgi:4-carboxymuconolactone decarboxylase
MTYSDSLTDTLPPLDAPTRCLVRLAAVIGAGTERQMRAHFVEARALPREWVEEVILQSYLFAGFPRSLNAAREWRRISATAAPGSDDDADATLPGTAAEWRARGEVTCATVYGDMYEKLRINITKLHPALDHWMITDGYGKVLSRPGLDLVRRELCVIATSCTRISTARSMSAHQRRRSPGLSTSSVIFSRRTRCDAFECCGDMCARRTPSTHGGRHEQPQ